MNKIYFLFIEIVLKKITYMLYSNINEIIYLPKK